MTLFSFSRLTCVHKAHLALVIKVVQLVDSVMPRDLISLTIWMVGVESKVSMPGQLRVAGVMESSMMEED